MNISIPFLHTKYSRHNNNIKCKRVDLFIPSYFQLSQLRTFFLNTGENSWTYRHCLWKVLVIAKMLSRYLAWSCFHSLKPLQHFKVINRFELKKYYSSGYCGFHCIYHKSQIFCRNFKLHKIKLARGKNREASEAYSFLHF